ncbi:hypothetical protein, partial [Escherichia coli]|uniref:hypothetical protein n=1 Tax=Escherichia coli TaxID=562 RepID=UPI003D00D34E
LTVAANKFRIAFSDGSQCVTSSGRTARPLVTGIDRYHCFGVSVDKMQTVRDTSKNPAACIPTQKDLF